MFNIKFQAIFCSPETSSNTVVHTSLANGALDKEIRVESNLG